MKIEELQAYEVVEKRKIEDLNSESYLLKHKKSGAKIALLSNDDENKVFYIGFRTPPANSTGVAHIIEHTVLCGSDKYPLKDPFIELAKGSLNTFLNAMTYPDKTLYPVASCNDKDFQNLMDVYLDAVFHPNIYKEEKIFCQEGWHYELENEEDQLKINGVVYNEMKGAFSSPDEVLEREMMNSLFPDTAYGVESGGDPVVIPQLSYEEFLDFHRKYYHPSNSYIYLYGNMDMAEKLDYLDKEYLSDYDVQPVSSELQIQKPFTARRVVEKEYPVGDEESLKDNGYLALNFAVGDSLNRELYVAFQILDYALCSAPGAPIKQTLIEKGIGQDVYSIYENGIAQPYFGIVAENVDETRKDEFVENIQQVLKQVLADGVNKKSLYAGLNNCEFKYREADFGSYPKGLMYGLQVMDSWLYDESKPFIHIEANETFATLRKKIETGYFEELIQKYLVDNSHQTLVVLAPKKGLTVKREQELKESLQAYKESLSTEEIQKIIRNTKELTTWQEIEESPENLDKIPLLTREDMKREATTLQNEMRKADEVPVLFHSIFTNGIAYLRLIFSLEEISEEYFEYIGLLKAVLGLLNTKNYSYGELYNEINIKTGGMSVVNNTYSRLDNLDSCKVTMELKTKVLYGQVKDAFELLEEIMFSSDFTDKKRLYELIAQSKSKLQAQMTSSGHTVAVNKALAGISTAAAYNEYLNGLHFYRNIEKWESEFESKSDEICEKLKTLVTMIFRKENLMLDLVSEEKAYATICENIPVLWNKLYSCPVEKNHFRPKLEKRREALKTSAQVQYVAKVGNFRKKGLKYTGALKALKVMLGYDYLWNQVRVKGGAYGCMCNFGKTGDCYFVSYRDPNLEQTLQTYQNAADYISHFDADERTLTQFIIGAVGELDMPMNPAAKGMYSLSGYMTGITNEMLQKDRDELLDMDAEKLRETAEIVRSFVEEECICVVGNAEKIEESKSIFETTEALFLS